MDKTQIRAHIQSLTHEDLDIRQQARAALTAGDEAIIDTLIDEFYAGVNEQTGIALLDIIGQIGGYMAINTLEYVYHFDPHDAWKTIAQKWLTHDGFM